ncbi:hypothetical protein K435DRAFT_701486, partial [Dendrothele bispora CBS 962.96]
LVVGSWLNTMLYALEISQVYEYFTNCTSDRRIFKISVIIVFLSDTIGTLATNALTYFVSYTPLEDMTFPYDSRSVPVFLFTANITATVVQTFMLYRYWILYASFLIRCFTT